MKGWYSPLIYFVLFLCCSLYTCGPLNSAGSLYNSVPYLPSSLWNSPIGFNPPYSSKTEYYLNLFQTYPLPSSTFEHDISRLQLTRACRIIVDSKSPSATCVIANNASLGTLTIVQAETDFNIVVNDSTITNVSSMQLPYDVIYAGSPLAGCVDAPVVFWNIQNGNEWGFESMQFVKNTWVAQGGYNYNTQWTGVPPSGFMCRGGGSPYLAGMIRKWEISQGQIDHVLGLALPRNITSSTFFPPATKGTTVGGLEDGIPMGTWFQLDPSITVSDFQRWGISANGIIIAVALQTYGMVLIDWDDTPRLFPENEGTAYWGNLLNEEIIAAIPVSHFQVLSYNFFDLLNSNTKPHQHHVK